MSMRFQEETEIIAPKRVPRLREFYGRIIDQMPLLISGTDKEGNVIDVPRQLMTPKTLLYERVHGTNEHDKALLQDNYVHTACAVINDPEGSGEVILGLYSDPVVKSFIDSLNPKTQLNDSWSMDIDGDRYHTIREKAFIFSPKVVNKLRADGYSEKKTRRAAWEYLAGGKSDVVNQNLKLVVDKIGGSFNDRMGFALYYHKGLRLWVVGSVGGHSNAGVGGNYLFGDDIARLVGVAPEALVRRENLGVVAATQLEGKVKTALDAGSSFEYNGMLCVPQKL